MKIIKKLLASVVVIVFGPMTLISLWVALKNAYVPFVGMFIAPDAVVENSAGFFSLWGKALLQLTFAAFMFAPCYAALKYLLKKEANATQSSTRSTEIDESIKERQ